MNEIKNRETTNSITILLIIGIILLALNLRAPITSVGPLVTDIRNHFQLSNTVIGVLTTLPLLAFAFVSPFAAKISRRFGLEVTIVLSLFLVSVGILLRSLGGVEALFIGTLFIGIGIAVGNVLLPGLVKQHFIYHIGLMTGVYAVSMNLSSAIATGVTVPIASIQGVGWQGALGFFGVFSVVALLFWILQLRYRHRQEPVIQEKSVQNSSQIWRSPLAWQVSLFMGLQSLIFYAVIAWFPGILQEQGLSASSAGWMISFMQFAILPFTFIVPIIAGRLKDQRSLAGVVAILFMVGICGVMIGNSTLIPFSMIIIGIASGSAFSLSMMFFSMRTETADEAAEMSGMAQSFGYTIAAVAPFLLGFLRDFTGNWTISLVVLLFVGVLLFVVGIGAGRNQTI